MFSFGLFGVVQGQGQGRCKSFCLCQFSVSAFQRGSNDLSNFGAAAYARWTARVAKRRHRSFSIPCDHLADCFIIVTNQRRNKILLSFTCQGLYLYAMIYHLMTSSLFRSVINTVRRSQGNCSQCLLQARRTRWYSKCQNISEDPALRHTSYLQPTLGNLIGVHASWRAANASQAWRSNNIRMCLCQ